MISFRYHLVSIIAVFLALALGILVGTTGLNGAILSDLKKQVRTLHGETASLRTSNDSLTTIANNDEKFASSYMKPILAGRLTGKTVAVISGPGISGRVKSGAIDALAASGAKVVTQIQLSPNYVDPARASDILNLLAGAALPSGINLPSSSDASLEAGAVLAYVLSGKGVPGDFGKVLSSFAGLNMLSVNNNPKTVSLAVVLTSGTYLKTDGRAKALPPLVTELNAYGIKTVVAGDPPSSTQAGLIQAVRADDTLSASVSTVDNADSSIGLVSTALALAGLVTGQAGKYGTGTGAESLFPPAAK